MKTTINLVAWGATAIFVVALALSIGACGNNNSIAKVDGDVSDLVDGDSGESENEIEDDSADLTEEDERSEEVDVVDELEIDTVDPIENNDEDGEFGEDEAIEIDTSDLAEEEVPLLDSDGDGIPDVNDNCPMVKNYDQKDWDKDNVGDACDPDIPPEPEPELEEAEVELDGDITEKEIPMEEDISEPESDEPPPDLDKDGIPDTIDNCPGIPNPLQEDLDNDQIGDVCDPDQDGDGICDPGVAEGTGGCRYDRGHADNCPRIPNVGDRDVDNDGVGDFCDNCHTTPNQDQKDRDQDGHGDACDAFPDDPERW